jgi:hypothetical protein
VAAFVLVLGAVSAVFAFGGGSGGRGGSGVAGAAEAVATAATQTINAQSADVSMSMNVSATGLSDSLTASGAFNFAQKTGSMTMTIPVNGTQYSEQEILDGSTIYVNVSGLGSGLTPPNTPWVAVPVDQSDNSDSGLSTLDPTPLLQQLKSAGATVSSLGQTTYDGTLATEYEATLPPSALESGMGALSSASGQNFGADFPDMTIDIYVTQDNLLKALVVPTYSFDIVGQTISVQMTMSFSNYGTAVNVTPPPPDQVEPFSQFGVGLGNSGSTGNTGNSGNSGCGCSNV